MGRISAWSSRRSASATSRRCSGPADRPPPSSAPQPEHERWPRPRGEQRSHPLVDSGQRRGPLASRGATSARTARRQRHRSRRRAGSRPAEHLHERALARAVLADQGMHLAGTQGERDAPQRPRLAPRQLFTPSTSSRESVIRVTRLPFSPGGFRSLPDAAAGPLLGNRRVVVKLWGATGSVLRTRAIRPASGHGFGVPIPWHPGSCRAGRAGPPGRPDRQLRFILCHFALRGPFRPLPAPRSIPNVHGLVRTENAVDLPTEPRHQGLRPFAAAVERRPGVFGVG